MDPEDELLEAFACFDEKDTGYVPVAQIREFLATLGDRMTQEEVSLAQMRTINFTEPFIQISRFLSPPFTDRHGNFAYRDFLKVLRITDADQQQQQQQQQEGGQMAH